MTDHEAAEEWLELSVEADYEAVESVVELFSRHGYQGGVSIEEPFTQDPDGDNLKVDITRPFAVSTFVSAASFDAALKEEIEQALWFLGSMRPVGSLRVTSHRETDWEEAWKKHFSPVRASDRFVIRPPWHEVEATPGDLVITLDPGMAFGTGTHPTTRLCLQLLESMPVAGKRVLDAGTGTGVLALGAVLLGADAVTAVDIDQVAVRQSGENVALNGLEGRISIREDDLSSPPEDGPFELVIANIISRILIEIHPALLAAMADDATLLLSGIIEDKEQGVIDCYAAAGLTRLDRLQMGDWIAHIWKRQI
ncbi:MAG: 50S ribosomal protein L11 methyltransferase [Thermomicrobiales bacterium]|nr:50S ribosomal protein L11 methyltransferase [Thermomicrobiales bacterium]